MRQLTTLESITVLAVVIVHDPPYVAMMLAAAFGPVLAVPGKQPPLPSDPSGTFAAEEAQPGAPVGVGRGVGRRGRRGRAVGVGARWVSAWVRWASATDWAGGRDGAAVTVVVTVAVTIALTVTVAVAPTVTVCVTVALGGLGEMQTTMIRCSLCAPVFARLRGARCLAWSVSVVAWTAPTLAPTTIEDRGQSGEGSALGCHGSLFW